MTRKSIFTCPICGEKKTVFPHISSCANKWEKKRYKEFEKRLRFCSLDSNDPQFQSSYKGHYLLGDPEGTYFSNRFEKGKVKGGSELRYYTLEKKWKLHFYWSFHGEKEDLKEDVEFTKSDFLSGGVTHLPVEVTLNQEFNIEWSKKYFSNVYNKKLSEACVQIGGVWYLAHIVRRAVIRGGPNWWFGEVGLHPYSANPNVDLPTIIYLPLNSKQINFVNFDLIQDTYIPWSTNWRSQLRILDEVNTTKDQKIVDRNNLHRPAWQSGDPTRDWPHVLAIEGDQIIVASPALQKVEKFDRNDKNLMRRRNAGAAKNFEIADIVNAKATPEPNRHIYGETHFVVVDANDVLVWLVDPKTGKTAIRLRHQCTLRTKFSQINTITSSNVFSDLGRCGKFKTACEEAVKANGVVCTNQRVRYMTNKITFKRVTGVQQQRGNSGPVSEYRQKVFLQGNTSGVTKSQLLYSPTPILPPRSWQNNLGDHNGLGKDKYTQLLLEMEVVNGLVHFEKEKQALDFVQNKAEDILDIIGFHPSVGGEKFIFHILNCGYLELARLIIFHKCRFQESLWKLKSQVGRELIISIYLASNQKLFTDFINMSGYVVQNPVDTEGNTLFHYAVTWDDMQLVDFLLNRQLNLSANYGSSKSILMVKNNEGATPLCIAVFQRNLKMVKKLVSHGASALMAGMWGNCPLQSAFVGCNPDVRIILYLRDKFQNRSAFEQMLGKPDCEGVKLSIRLAEVERRQFKI